MSFNTDKLRESVTAKFTPALLELSDGTEIALAPLTRLDADARKAVVSALEDFSELPDDAEDEATISLAVEALEKLLGLIASDAERLLKDMSDPDPLIYSNLLGEIVSYWGRETRLGEAQNSAG